MAEVQSKVKTSYILELSQEELNTIILALGECDMNQMETASKRNNVKTVDSYQLYLFLIDNLK